jgi:hypothetical protein
MPRMADFAQWVTAAEPALGWERGTFLQAYKENRAQGNLLSLESSHIAHLLLALVNDGNPRWEGTLKELLALLDGKAKEDTRKLREWPRTPRSLSGHLRRLAPNLRRAGLVVTFGKHARTGTPITLEWVGESPSPQSQSSPASNPKDLWRDGGRDGQGRAAGRPSQQPSHPNPLSDKGGDGGERGEGGLQACSEDSPASAQTDFEQDFNDAGPGFVSDRY